MLVEAQDKDYLSVETVMSVLLKTLTIASQPVDCQSGIVVQPVLGTGVHYMIIVLKKINCSILQTC